MANNEHSSLANAQLHNPKDFSTASNSTHLTKNSSGALTWADDIVNRTHFVRLGGYMNKSTTDMYGTTWAAGHHHVFDTVVTDPTADAQEVVAQSFLYCSRAGYLAAWKGAAAITSAKTCEFRIFKGTPVDNSSAAIDLTQLGDTVSETGEGGTSIELFAATGLSTSTTFAAGDVLIATLKPTAASSTVVRFNSILEIVYTG
tara:strand:+ start:12973 stop:13578 length:606 start_codon:yes stop_codon:yes gene_type:complete